MTSTKLTSNRRDNIDVLLSLADAMKDKNDAKLYELRLRYIS